MTKEERNKMFIEGVLASMSQPMQEQATITNKAFRFMSGLEMQLKDLNEQVNIARLQWAREDRKWREMLLADAQPEVPK